MNSTMVKMRNSEFLSIDLPCPIARKFNLVNTDNLWIDLKGAKLHQIDCLLTETSLQPSNVDWKQLWNSTSSPRPKFLTTDGLFSRYERETTPRSNFSLSNVHFFQLQTAAGSAIKHFHNARCINVPRSRFLPVKDCSDLLRVKSDLFVLEHGRLVMSQHRMFTTMPSIKLGGHFKKVYTS